MELLKELGGIVDLVLIALIVVAVQGIKIQASKTKALSDWFYMGLAAIFTIVVQFFVADFSQGWQAVGNKMFVNFLATLGTYSFSKKIPWINNFITSTESPNGTENKTPPPPAP
ncbi:MAG: hypothetical protein CV087_07510 [Candidatus Brocadia sp. WS118]|nr:MAG: hypothetical protein CV087_07510 [Candidatus Brocadia sp. WS118]